MIIYDSRPVPTKKNSKTKEYRDLILSMKVGQSFDIPYKDRHCIRSISFYGKAAIATRRNSDLLSVWRTL